MVYLKLNIRVGRLALVGLRVVNETRERHDDSF